MLFLNERPASVRTTVAQVRRTQASANPPVLKQCITEPKKLYPVIWPPPHVQAAATGALKKKKRDVFLMSTDRRLYTQRMRAVAFFRASIFFRKTCEQFKAQKSIQRGRSISRQEELFVGPLPCLPYFGTLLLLARFSIRCPRLKEARDLDLESLSILSPPGFDALLRNGIFSCSHTVLSALGQYSFRVISVFQVGGT